MHTPSFVFLGGYGQGPWSQIQPSQWGGQKCQKIPKIFGELKVTVDYPRIHFWPVWDSYMGFRHPAGQPWSLLGNPP